MTRRIVFVAAAVLCCLSVQAVARDKVNKEPLIARTLDTFNQNVDRIHQQMQPGGVYEHVSPTEKSRVDHDIELMRKLLQAHASENDMPADDKVALANAQEEVNGILSHNDNNRLICERSAATGSHIRTTRCRTYGEIMARREQDQKSLRDRTAITRMKSPGGGL